MADQRYVVVRIELSPRGARYTRLLRNPARGDDDEITNITHVQAFGLLQGDALAEVSMGDDKGHCLESADAFDMYAQ